MEGTGRDYCEQMEAKSTQDSCSCLGRRWAVARATGRGRHRSEMLMSPKGVFGSTVCSQYSQEGLMRERSEGPRRLHELCQVRPA